MSVRETLRGRGATSRVAATRRRLGRAVLGALALGVAMAAFPAFAGAIVLAPLLGPVSATPSMTGATLNATIYPYGADTHYRFEYGPTSSYGTSVPVPDGNAGSGSAAVPVSQDVTGLLPNTTYHFRLSAAHGSGAAATTSDQTFTTPPSGPAPPSAVVSAPVATAGGFELEGAINPNGVDTHYHFEFGETIAYGEDLPEPDADIGSGSSAVSVGQEVTGLLPNTTYHYRVVAGNAEGPGVSTDRTFTTPPDPPVVLATPFTESAAGWSLNGSVNPNGGATTYHFQFGITTAYGSNVPATDAGAGSGTGAIAVTQLVSSLPPGVPYHYRLVAHNAGGTSISNDEEFVTPPVASVPDIPLPPPALTLPSIAPPPLVAPPSNQVKVKPPVSSGTGATLQVSVPGAGTVSASGKGLKTATATAQGAGVVTLKLKLTGAGMAKLRQASGHRLAVKVSVVFKPNGGSAGTTSKTVVFKGGRT